MSMRGNRPSFSNFIICSAREELLKAARLNNTLHKSVGEATLSVSGNGLVD